MVAFMSAGKLRRLYELEGPQKTVRHLREALALKEGRLKPEDFSLRDLAEGLVQEGADWVRGLDPRSGSSVLLEAGNAVDTSAFSNITGQIVYSTVMEAYNDPVYLWPRLCKVIPTKLSGEKIPGIGQLGDDTEIVDEGMPYPLIGLQEEWIETPETIKRGLIVPVTKEAVFFDRTNLVLTRAGNVGRTIAISREKRILDLAVGVTNNYKYKSTAYNTYNATTPWANQITNALVDWTDVEAAELKFEGMTDPVTGEPITVIPTSMLVPGALRYTARRILGATEVHHVDMQVQATTYRTIASNPVPQYEELSNPYVVARSGNAAYWYLGDFKKAFAYMENWGPAIQQAADNSEADFNRDIVAQYKISERGAAAVLSPRHVCKSTGAG